MKVITIYSYLVDPVKSSETKTIINGTAVERTGTMFNMLNTIFIDAEVECKY